LGIKLNAELDAGDWSGYHAALGHIKIENLTLHIFRRMKGIIVAMSVLASVVASGAALAEPSAVYLVRHAEKGADGKDPGLTPRGVARARSIAAILGQAGITAIFSTPTARTQQTAAPLAQRTGLSVQLYDPRAPLALVEQVKAMHGAVLVVGHSNTLPELVRLFGGAPGADIGEEEYARLYQLLRGPDGQVKTILLSSPPVDGVAL
jgi:phosphohistidine phosphatase SixA